MLVGPHELPGLAAGIADVARQFVDLRPGRRHQKGTHPVPALFDECLCRGRQVVSAVLVDHSPVIQLYEPIAHPALTHELHRLPVLGIQLAPDFLELGHEHGGVVFKNRQKVAGFDRGHLLFVAYQDNPGAGVYCRFQELVPCLCRKEPRLVHHENPVFKRLLAAPDVEEELRDRSRVPKAFGRQDTPSRVLRRGVHRRMPRLPERLVKGLERGCLAGAGRAAQRDHAVARGKQAFKRNPLIFL